MSFSEHKLFDSQTKSWGVPPRGVWLGRIIIIFRNFEFEKFQKNRKIFSNFENKIMVWNYFQYCDRATRHKGVPPNVSSASRKAYILKSSNPEGFHVKLISLRERDL